MQNRTAKRLKTAMALQSQGATPEDISAITEESPQAIRRLLTTAPKIVKKHDWRELAEHANAGKAFVDDSDLTTKYSTVTIDTDEPIAVVYTADWHLGDRYTNYDAWRTHIETIMDNDNIFMITLGDENQNARSFKNLSMVLDQVLSPSLQIQLLNGLFDELIQKRKIMAKVLGNHDAEFDERIYGEKLVGYTDKLATIPIFSNRGILEIKVGDQSYSNLLFHKSRFRSFLRPTHGAYREWQLSYAAEVVAGGHDHVPGIEILYGRTPIGDPTETFLVKSGTFQESEFGWRYFHNGGPMTPTVIYYPHTHKKLIFTNVDDALKFIH